MHPLRIHNDSRISDPLSSEDVLKHVPMFLGYFAGLPNKLFYLRAEVRAGMQATQWRLLHNLSTSCISGIIPRVSPTWPFGHVLYLSHKPADAADPLISGSDWTYVGGSNDAEGQC
jgi:hypothetical protein